VAAARDADLLLHEALAPHIVSTIEQMTRAEGRPRIAKIMADIPDYHTSPVAAAKAANEANVGRLVLYHLVPGPPPGVAEQVFLRGVSAVRKDVTLAVDGSIYTLPAGSREIREREL